MKKEMSISEFEKAFHKNQIDPHDIGGFTDQVLVASPWFSVNPSKTQAICCNLCKDPEIFKKAIKNKEYTGIFHAPALVGKYQKKNVVTGKFPVTFAFVMIDKKVIYGLISCVDENDHLQFLPMKKSLQDKQKGYIKINILQILGITFQADKNSKYEKP